LNLLTHATLTLADYNVVKGCGAKVVIGFLLSTSTMLNPPDLAGVTGGVTAQQESRQNGIDAHAQFLEVAEVDVLNPTAQDVLATIASELAYVMP